MRRHLQLQMIVPVGDEVSSARALWAQMTAEERKTMGRLAAEWCLLAEASSEARVLIAPASVLEEAGLPAALTESEGRR